MNYRCRNARGGVRCKRLHNAITTDPGVVGRRCCAGLHRDGIYITFDLLRRNCHMMCTLSSSQNKYYCDYSKVERFR